MRRFEITVSDTATYEIEARSEDDAIDQALEYFDERNHDYQCKEICRVSVNEAPLHEVIENWVETFNDCACCPCENCPLDFGESFHECADRIIKTVLKKGRAD